MVEIINEAPTSKSTGDISGVLDNQICSMSITTYGQRGLKRPLKGLKKCGLLTHVN